MVTKSEAPRGEEPDFSAGAGAGAAITPPEGRVLLVPGETGKGEDSAAFLSSDFLTSVAAVAVTAPATGATTPGAQFRVLSYM